MSSDFDQATAVSEIAADVFEWVVPDGWQQGRGAWGGLPIGALIKCVIAAQSGGGFGAELNDDQRLVRSLNCQIYAPVLVGAQRVTTALIGASKVSQIEDCVAALKNTTFTPDELARIDRYARDGDINLWAASSAG